MSPVQDAARRVPPRLTPHDRFFLPLFAGTIGLAWLALAAWDFSPYSRYLQHDWTRLGLLASLCTTLTTGQAAAPALVFLAGWVLMTAAMMLPTTLPLMVIFHRLTARRPDATALTLLLVLGYLLVWLGFGIAAHLLGLAMAWLSQRSAWLIFDGWVIGAGILLLAGLFQFSSLKYRCLEGCRSPLGFVLSRWDERRPRPGSFRIGLAHGAYCVGCCWLLMLLMFVVGSGSIGWMLGLGAVMALEKNSPWGKRLAAPLGIALIIAAAGVTAHGLGGL